MSQYRIVPAGDSVLILEFEERIDPVVNAKAIAICSYTDENSRGNECAANVLSSGCIQLSGSPNKGFRVVVMIPTNLQ